MPNGGVPINMILSAGDGQYILHCYAAQIRVFSRSEWEKEKGCTPMFVLKKNESLVLERFLRYWLQDTEDGPIYRPDHVKVDYEF